MFCLGTLNGIGAFYWKRNQTVTLLVDGKTKPMIIKYGELQGVLMPCKV